jgi:hypothetical protein
MLATIPGRDICLYCLTIGGKGLGILTTPLEHPRSIKREKVIAQKSDENILCRRMGYAPKLIS